MIEFPLLGDDHSRTAVITNARWLQHLQLWRPTDPDTLTTGAVETAVLLLAGTFDLSAAGTAWPARGARHSPLAGRPMAVFLPPRTQFSTQQGSGEILLIAARQPEQEEPSGRESLSRKPLLPMAGSGKAFDPQTGEWRPAETFATAAESLPPRRFERLTAGVCTVERVFARDYKAATLSLDEVVVAAGQTLCLRDIPARPTCDEVLLFVRCVEPMTIEHQGRSVTATGDRVYLLPDAAAAQAADITLRATGGCYCVIAYAGKSCRPE